MDIHIVHLYDALQQVLDNRPAKVDIYLVQIFSTGNLCTSLKPKNICYKVALDASEWEMQKAVQAEAALLEDVVDEVDQLDSENEDKPKKWKWDSDGGASARRRKTSMMSDAKNIIVSDPSYGPHVDINVELDNQWYVNTLTNIKISGCTSSTVCLKIVSDALAHFSSGNNCSSLVDISVHNDPSHINDNSCTRDSALPIVLAGTWKSVRSSSV
ncbi:hypothetical protein ARMGADRAFT_1077785 [Armillaria gallica]|uniref:Uncharacterized protein n=1 Tax=Armillaria gallica TaxID=47427 RepID=A0A2H3DLR1_ARMGA|nr:hypothetical protein ARMGADRAFT_1077785 [Armillaria gallica]